MRWCSLTSNPALATSPTPLPMVVMMMVVVVVMMVMVVLVVVVPRDTRDLDTVATPVTLARNHKPTDKPRTWTQESEYAKEQLKNYIELKRSLECSLDQEKKKNGELEKEITGFKKLLKLTRRKLDEYENGELRFPGDLKPNHIEMDIQINMLKQKIDDLTAKLETSSLKCLRLDEENQLLRQELVSMKGIQKKCEIQENKKKS
uniref:Uncharacterized protein n=1 Tax=Rousettus aegyptiacus TaxID=9407 RepID=A0A7J8E8K7_ROUAE|nr:hypothetical protein HJG63_008173 [Rousettus aegyptiacus]